MPGKVRDGKIPRTPSQWREVSASWRARYVQGKTLEKGLDVVFGLTPAGWQREVYRVVDPVEDKEIRVDLYLDESDSPTSTDENAEAKTGALNRDRDVVQLEGYPALLQRGETVRLYTRAERDTEMSKEARTLLTLMKAEGGAGRRGKSERARPPVFARRRPAVHTRS
ncbi:hypothetical protein [Nocardia sp. NPDC003963]